MYLFLFYVVLKTEEKEQEEEEEEEEKIIKLAAGEDTRVPTIANGEDKRSGQNLWVNILFISLPFPFRCRRTTPQAKTNDKEKH